MMNNLQIFEHAALLYKSSADLIVQISKKAIAHRGRCCIALSGGNTPRRLYELLANEQYRDSIEWKNTFVFWSDERCVPFSDDQNNSHMAFAALLHKIPIPAENIFPVPVQLPAPEAAMVYEKTIQDFFKEDLPAFDLILLGLGDNGHTASLFPFTSILKENRHLVKEVFVDELQSYRISFTAPLINSARHILLLVTGKEKSSIVKTIFSGTPDPERYPVQLITSSNVQWYLDKDAGSQINKN